MHLSRWTHHTRSCKAEVSTSLWTSALTPGMTHLFQGFSVRYLAHTHARIQTAEQLRWRWNVTVGGSSRVTRKSNVQFNNSVRIFLAVSLNTLVVWGNGCFRYLKGKRCRSQQENAEGLGQTRALGQRPFNTGSSILEVFFQTYITYPLDGSMIQKTNHTSLETDPNYPFFEDFVIVWFFPDYCCYFQKLDHTSIETSNKKNYRLDLH